MAMEDIMNSCEDLQYLAASKRLGDLQAWTFIGQEELASFCERKREEDALYFSKERTRANIIGNFLFNKWKFCASAEGSKIMDELPDATPLPKATGKSFLKLSLRDIGDPSDGGLGLFDPKTPSDFVVEWFEKKEDWEDGEYETFQSSEDWHRYTQFCELSCHICTFEDFDKLRVLGRGGFGMVFGTQRRQTGKMMADKTQNKLRVKKARSEKLVLSERDVLEKVKSKFVVNLHYSYATETDLHLVLELMSGGDLGFHVRNAMLTKKKGKKDESGKPAVVSWPAFSPEQTVYYAACTYAGLLHLHKAGYAYRDLKPDNILMTDEGVIKLSDLGLAYNFKRKRMRGRVGTRGYWAPEMLRKDEEGHYCPYDERADWWTFGVVCYEFGTGICPFRTNKAQAYIHNDPNSKPTHAVEPSPQNFPTTDPGKGAGGRRGSKMTRRGSKAGGGDMIDDGGRDLGSTMGKAFDSVRNQVAVVTRSKDQINESMDKAILHMSVPYDLKAFKYHSNLDSLCEALIQRNPDERLVAEQIQDHPFFASIDWDSFMRGEMEPPWKPSGVINARSQSEIGDFEALPKNLELTEDDKRLWRKWNYISPEYFFEEAAESAIGEATSRAKKIEMANKMSEVKQSSLCIII